MSLYLPTAIAVTCPYCGKDTTRDTSVLDNGYNIVKCQWENKAFVVNIHLNIDCKTYKIESEGERETRELNQIEKPALDEK